MEKVNEIKKINAQMVGIKSEISKHEDTLKEYQLYRSFLESLIPAVSEIILNPNLILYSLSWGNYFILNIFNL